MADSRPIRESGLWGCEDCGAEVVGGRDACKQLFEQVLVKEYSNYRYGKIHRLTVDCYAMQHPGYTVSAKSFAAHLAGLCCAMEHNRSAMVYKRINAWLNGPMKVGRPPVRPVEAGALTILHIVDARTPEEHNKRVQEWARSVWESWREYHVFAREWLLLAMVTTGETLK